MFILDTNIMIYFAAGDAEVYDFVNKEMALGEIAVPTICIVEFLSFQKITKNEKDNFLLFANKLSILPLDYQSALAAAQLRLTYNLKVVDSVIAAAAITRGGILVSRDKEFKKIKELEVLVM